MDGIRSLSFAHLSLSAEPPQPSAPPLSPRSDVEKIIDALKLRSSSATGDAIVDHLLQRPDARHLTLEVNEDDELPAELGQLQGLTHLNLTTNSEASNIACVSELTQLQHLVLEDVVFSSEQCWDVLRPLTELESLDLKDAFIAAPIPAWFNSANFPQLSSLSLPAYAVVTTRPAPAGGALHYPMSALPGVQSLSVSNIHDRVPHLALQATVDGLRQMPQLRRLELQWDGCSSLCPSINKQNFPQLNSLVIHGRLADVPLSLIALDADIELSDARLPGSVEALARMQRAELRLAGQINSGFSLAGQNRRFSDDAVGTQVEDMQHQLHLAWHEAVNELADHQVFQPALNDNLQRLQLRMTHQIQALHTLLEDRYSAPATRNGVEVAALKNLQDELEQVHGSHEYRLGGAYPLLAVQREALQQLIENLSPAEEDDMESVFEGVLPPSNSAAQPNISAGGSVQGALSHAQEVLLASLPSTTLALLVPHILGPHSREQVVGASQQFFQSLGLNEAQSREATLDVVAVLSAIQSRMRPASVSSQPSSAEQSRSVFAQRSFLRSVAWTNEVYQNALPHEQDAVMKRGTVGRFEFQRALIGCIRNAIRQPSEIAAPNRSTGEPNLAAASAASRRRQRDDAPPVEHAQPSSRQRVEEAMDFSLESLSFGGLTIEDSISESGTELSRP